MVLLFILIFLTHDCVSFEITVFGMAGHGKSSFVQFLCNCTIPTSSDEEMTMESQKYNISNYITLTDTPGFGTRRFPILGHFEKYRSNCGIVVLIITNRIYEQHYQFVKDVGDTNKIVIVRTQTDIFPFTNYDYIEKELGIYTIIPFHTGTEVTRDLLLQELIMSLFLK